MGDIEVHSYLNDPLDAEIIVHSTDTAEILNARVQLASRVVHDKAGVDINQHVRRLKFKPVAKSNGKFSIQITTRRPVSEPVLEFIVEVTGSSSNLIRGYSIHLDPPNLN
ncbi:MAG: hypothetical protein KAT25_08705 [Sulfuriflexus sp.]|nr:hypothetical protein [Sulfuriflexus sp.]